MAAQAGFEGYHRGAAAADGRGCGDYGARAGGGGAAQDAAALVSETLALVSEGQAQFNAENTGALTGRSIVVLGDTGAGKSTLINLIANRRLRSQYDETTGRTFIDAINPLAGFKIGHNLRSETFVPHKFVNDGVMYWDCPGFTDNRGVPREIANTVCIQKIFETSPNIKVLIIVNDDEIIAPRATNFMALLRLIDQAFLGSVDRVTPALSLVVSRTQRTKEQVKRSIENIIRDLRVEGPQLQLLQALHSNPITIFRKPDHGEARDIDTRGTRDEILENISRIPYASNVRINLSLSDFGKRTAIDSYNFLSVHIRKNIGDFLKAFTDGIESAAKPFSNKDSKMTEEQRKSGEKKLTPILEKIKTITQVEYNGNNVNAMISKCAEIASDCGKQLPASSLTEPFKRLELMRYLEQFVDHRAHIPLEIVHEIREKVNEGRTVLEKALINITAMNETDRAEKQAKLAEDERKNAQNEKKRADEAEEKYKKSDSDRREAENRANIYRAQGCPPGGGNGGCILL